MNSFAANVVHVNADPDPADGPATAPPAAARGRFDTPHPGYLACANSKTLARVHKILARVARLSHSIHEFLRDHPPGCFCKCCAYTNGDERGDLQGDLLTLANVAELVYGSIDGCLIPLAGDPLRSDRHTAGVVVGGKGGAS